MSNTLIKFISTIILAFTILINGIGNFIGVGDIIPTEPAEENTTSTTVVETTEIDEGAAEFLAFFNAETAKIVNEGSYTINRSSEYTSPIDVGSATNVLNGIIGAIDDNSNIDSVVGNFLGIGVTKRDVPEDDVNSNYKLKATTLKEEDLLSFTVDNGTYTFTLADATNPKKTGATSFSRLTNDFVTHEEVVDGIADFTSVVRVNDTDVTYKNIKVTVKVADGKITDISYSYDFDATIELKAVVIITGTGAVKTNGTYSNINY